MKKCVKCENDLLESETYCRKCGTLVGDNTVEVEEKEEVKEETPVEEEKKDNKKIGNILSGIAAALIIFGILSFFINVSLEIRKYLILIGITSFLVGLVLSIFVLIKYPSNKLAKVIGVVALIVVIFTGVIFYLLAQACADGCGEAAYSCGDMASSGACD